MKILGIHIPFTERHDYPLLWFDDPEHIIINAQQSKISLQDGRKKTLFERIFNLMFDLVLLAVGLLFIIGPILMTLIDVVPAYLDEESDEPCWPDQKNAITLSDGDVFCEWGQRSETYSDYQIADNHYQISVTSQTGGNVGNTEYRWSEDNGIITSASIWQDEFGERYECRQYIRASSLPDNWTGNDLFIHYDEEYHYPAWCNDEPSQDEQEYTETNTIPFEGELLYHLDVSDRLYGIYTTQFTENDKVNYTNHEQFYPYPHFEPLMLIFVLVFGGVGVVMLSFIDRKRVLTIDGMSNQVKFEYVKWPRYGTINYELQSPISYEIVKKTRTITHSEGGDEGSPSRTWTTTHRGVDVAFDLVGEGLNPLLFLEGKNPQTKFESILELLFSTLGIKEEEDSQKWWDSDDQS